NVAASLPVSCDSDKLDLAVQRLIEAAIIDSESPDTPSDNVVKVSAKAEQNNGLIVIAYQTLTRRPSRKFLFDKSETRHRYEEGDELLSSLQTSLSLSQELIEKMNGEIIVLCDQQQHSLVIKFKLNQSVVEQ
ncbi:MAG: hypothetical protein QG574_1930, partial [Cyanobacteriota bacterium erpe_2018_sw_21hr_WHONDRS-SW48-000092_B_bin.40]|nr:hypothetical protein [Cyanobacteriota bacterium erpe_2018_sw_21hr_WHONDRS-SW48-000092_B_bin.40]